VLGDDHPLARTTTLVHALANQIVAVSVAVALGAVAVAVSRSWAWHLFEAALLVDMTLLAILGCARQIQREHVLRLCAFGPEVDAILAQLRARPRLRGLALLELMLIAGDGSALYGREQGAIRERLWRIRVLLADSDHEEEREPS
jgi:hypothetical protein